MISVVVCTYNRARQLAVALESLCSQNVSWEEYEVLVVDNNSSDGTKSVTQSFCNDYRTIRYCVELSQGLSFARNRGLKEARGDYIAYVDDDCKMPPGWIECALDVINKEKPAVFGGPFFAFYNTPKPKWFKDRYESHVPFSESRILTAQESVNIFGGNMFFRRDILEATEGFDISLGMSGESIAYGEETALVKKITVDFPDEKIFFEPNLFLYHLVHESKMQLWRIIRENFSRGRHSFRVFHGGELSIPPLTSLALMTGKVFVLLGWDVIRGLVARNRQRYPFFMNYLYEHSFAYLKKLGKLYEMHRMHLG